MVFNKPFSFCGVDYAGTLLAKTQDGVCKVWLALFVCGTTSAIHLKVVNSLSMHQSILAFQRFVARRGKPYQIVSDNAANFKAAATVLDVRWKFNPPASPWFGGFYERLVMAVKTPLKKVLCRAMLTLVELTTLVILVEAVVNSRPLMHVGDFTDALPITPAKLLGEVWKDGNDEKQLLSSQSHLYERLQYAESVMKHLMQCWEPEYVAQLRIYQLGSNRAITEGELVFVRNDKKKINFGSLGW